MNVTSMMSLISCDNVAGFGALMAADRDYQQLQRQKNQSLQLSSTHDKRNSQKLQQTVNSHKTENTNHNNSSPEIKPKQSSKSPKTTKFKVCIFHLLNITLLLCVHVAFKEVIWKTVS